MSVHAYFDAVTRELGALNCPDVYQFLHDLKFLFKFPVNFGAAKNVVEPDLQTKSKSFEDAMNFLFVKSKTVPRTWLNQYFSINRSL